MLSGFYIKYLRSDTSPVFLNIDVLVNFQRDLIQYKTVYLIIVDTTVVLAS